MKALKEILLIVALLIALLGFFGLALPAEAEGLWGGELLVESGYDTFLDLPYATLGGEVSVWYFAMHGSIRTDITSGGDFKGIGFAPVRSIYSIGAYFEYSMFQVGWYHECTHPGDAYNLIAASERNWDSHLARPNMNQFYGRVTLSFGDYK